MFVLEVFVKITHRRETCSTEGTGNSYKNMIHFDVVIDIGGFLIVVITFKTFPDFTTIFSLYLNHL